MAGSSGRLNIPLEKVMAKTDALKLEAQMDKIQDPLAPIETQDGKLKKGKYEPVTLLPPKEPTWRANVPILRDLEYWRHVAARYPYIRESDAQPDHWIRGISVHPRLSDFPQCKDVIEDVYRCIEYNPFLRMLNMCAPIKEQMCSCINLVFLKNSFRKSRKHKIGADASEHMEKKREKRLHLIGEKAKEIQDRSSKLSD